MEANEIKLGSILFGNRTVERERVLAIVLRPIASQPRQWAVRTQKGSVFVLDEVVFEPAALLALLVQGLFEVLDGILVPRGLKLKGA